MTKQINVKDIPTDLWDRVRVLAIEQKRPVAQIVAAALRLYLARQEKEEG